MKNIPLKVLPGYALIQIAEKYQSGLIADRDKYSTNSSGTLLDLTISADAYPEHFPVEELLQHYQQFTGKTVYFTPYEDGDIIKIEDTEYVFVPVKALRGGKV